MKILLYFLDPDKVRGLIADLGPRLDGPEPDRSFYKPGHNAHFRSDKVVDSQCPLSDYSGQRCLHTRMIAAICGIEPTTFQTQHPLN